MRKRNTSDNLAQGFYRELLADTKELYRLARHGIRGASGRIRNPDYNNGNANGTSEYADFPGFYQLEGVKFLLDKKRILLADGMGVGKTAQAVLGKLELENKTGRKVPTLVITPNSVREHWYREIHQYCEEQRIGRVVVLDEYTREALERVKDADFVIVNYDMFSRTDNSTRDRLSAQGFGYVILDEVHNIKNPAAVRSGHIKEIADRAEYLCLLSGTPIPNRLNDIYMLIALLEKDTYKEVRDEQGQVVKTAAQAVREAHWNQPRILRVILERRRLRRELADIAQLPKVDEQLGPDTTLNAAQMVVYDDILNNNMLEGTYKLQQLTYALLDPSLVDPEALTTDALKAQLAETRASKYDALDRIIEKRTSRGEKVVVYSPIFQDGVTQKLAERYKNCGAVVMDGTNARMREAIRQKFQHNPENSVLIATDVAGEGINLAAASTVVFLYNPYTPGERQQMIKRVHRRGQKKPVEVITLAIPGTVDEGVIELLRQKEKTISFIERGAPLDEEQKEFLFRKDYATRPVTQFLYTPQQKINRWSYQMCRMGARRLYKNLNRKGSRVAKEYAENYTIDWDTSVSANTARLYKWIIGQLESRGKLGRKIDIGSGPGVLSRITGEKTTNTDLNIHHFKQNFTDTKNANVVSALHSLPFLSELYDLAVCANSLNDTSLELYGGFTERELAIREANRILKQGGYYIMTLPRGVVTEEQGARLQEGLQQLGFEVVPEFTGFARSTDENTRFNIYVATARKVGGPSPERLSKEYLELIIDDRTVGRKERKRSFPSQRKRGVCTEFEFE